jgi:AcrR family transcriptional regulator
VLRKFGSKEGLFEAAGEEIRKTILAARVPPAHDVRAAVAALVASYDSMGQFGWNGLRQEDRFPWIKEKMDAARAGHREWVETAFAHLLPARPRAERERRILLLFAATDFYIWKLFRRDLDLGLETTIERMIDLVYAAAGTERGDR